MKVPILLKVKRIIEGGGFNELTIMLVDFLTTFGDCQWGFDIKATMFWCK
jgi:hypothetical protein